MILNETFIVITVIFYEYNAFNWIPYSLQSIIEILLYFNVVLWRFIRFIREKEAKFSLDNESIYKYISILIRLTNCRRKFLPMVPRERESAKIKQKPH